VVIDEIIQFTQGELSVLRLVIARALLHDENYYNDNSVGLIGSIQEKISAEFLDERSMKQTLMKDCKLIYAVTNKFGITVEEAETMLANEKIKEIFLDNLQASKPLNYQLNIHVTNTEPIVDELVEIFKNINSQVLKSY
jgi:hypothetical protein